MRAVYIVPAALEKVPQQQVREQIRWELPTNDRRIKDAFVEGMERMHQRHRPPGEEADMERCCKYVAETERRSGALVKKLITRFGIGKKRGSQKNGWSPCFMANKIQLSTLIEIRRHSTGARHREKWPTERQRDGLQTLLDGWEEQVVALDLSEEVQQSLVSLEIHSLNWWREQDILPGIEILDADIAALKKTMHGRNRVESRIQMNRAVKLREQMRKDGKLRPVIKSLLGVLAGPRHQDGADLSILRRADGRTTATALEGHEVATAQLRTWFAGTQTEGDTIHTVADWEKCLTDEQFFMEHTAHTQVPEVLRRKIFDALSNVQGRDETDTMMEEAFAIAPEFEDWQDLIQGSHNNSSGGMSGCSYNQLKMWPEAVSRSVFMCLARLWENKRTPVSWKWRWLVPIPKNAAVIPSVEDLRPLILVEAARKVWSKLILRKLKKCWMAHPLLNEAQHGYRAARSTMTASLIHLNLLEDAWDSGRELHSTSWDMSKAFDSVSKNVMRMAWRRVGVPKDVTEWLVTLDIAGTTVVRTPYAIEQWNINGYNSVITNDDMAQTPEGIERNPILGMLQAFSAERGTGQGDVTSPTCWNSVFDILLTALY